MPDVPYKYSTEELDKMSTEKVKYLTVVESLLDQFKAEMLAKLKLRAERHPNDNILSCSVEDLMNYDLQPIIEHFNLEIEELYTARGFLGPKEIRKECVDVANMSFIEWMIRKIQEK